MKDNLRRGEIEWLREKTRGVNERESERSARERERETERAGNRKIDR